MKAVYYTAAELAARGSGDIPPELNSSTHLIYSSPATLAFNSPGAEGYGVKRAGLAVPESVMLIVSPGCCGRNTSAISRMPGYEDRFFYLTMNETDLVTGRHLKRIPKAVEELCSSLAGRGKRPRVVMICITCVDALLGTDMERVCRRAQEKVPGVRVQPCYMYALTREGRKPPMVHVRQSIYELLEPRKKRASSVNLLGFFSPLAGTPGMCAPSESGRDSDQSGRAGKSGKGAGSELFAILAQAGVRTVRQIGACPDYHAFQEMAEANFNLVLNPEARPAAYDLQKRLGIPFIELTRFYQIDRIEVQYAALGRVLQTSFEDKKWKEEAEAAVSAFRDAFPDAVFSVGEGMNGNPFELACALLREGFAVREIFGTVTSDSFVWLRIIAALSPDTRIYSNLHPTMLHYQEEQKEETSRSLITKNSGPHRFNTEALHEPADLHGRGITIGRDAGWYHPELPNVQWISDIQPYGYGAVTDLFRALKAAMEEGSRDSFSPDVTLGNPGKKKTGAEAGGRDSISPEFTAGNPYKKKTAAESDLAAGNFDKKQTVLASEPAPGISDKDAGQRKTAENAVGDSTSVAEEDKQKKTAGESAFLSVKDRQEITAGDGAFLSEKDTHKKNEKTKIRGFREFSTPFAPDQSGAVSVLYDMKGISVVCDAGGCTGNICGFDEPRWFERQSAVFSAGLRDMDAILGRDDRLVEKLTKAAREVPADFAAIIGTPVPAVIGTDYRALCRMAKEKTGLPVLGISTDGMEYYDRGIEKTYLALLDTFCGQKADREKIIRDLKRVETETGGEDPVRQSQSDIETNPLDTAPKGTGQSVGVWGFTPLDFAGIMTSGGLRLDLIRKGWEDILYCGSGSDTGSLRSCRDLNKNLVVSPAGDAAAKWLEKKYGTPWEYYIPGEEALFAALSEKLPESGKTVKKVLIVHQQVLADRLRRRFLEAGTAADTAGFFMMMPELKEPGDVQLREEANLRALVLERGYDFVIADRALEPALYGLSTHLIHLPHFAVSGQAEEKI